MSGLERTFGPRRLEIIKRAGGRRVWSPDTKAAILEETLAPGAVVSVVARRPVGFADIPPGDRAEPDGLTPQQVFGWRREARRARETVPEAAPMAFVPAVVAAPEPEPKATMPPRPTRSRRSRRRGSPASIELEVKGVVVRVGAGASEAQIAAVIRALKATA